MKKFFALAVVFAALAGGVGITASVYAQDVRPAPQVPAQPEHGMMMGGDMSSMMARMNKMMDACEKMMQSKDQNQPVNPRG